MTTIDPPATWHDVTPAIAAEWLAFNDGNRHARGRLIRGYARDMAAGHWKVTGETIKFDRDGRLIDGQHRLLSIIETGTTQRMLIVRDLDPDAARYIDTGAVRTGGDALRMLGLGGNSSNAVAAAARLYVLWESGRLAYMGSALRADDRASHAEIIDIVTRRPDLIDAVRDSTRDYERIGIPAGPQAMTRIVLADIDAADSIRFFDAMSGYATDGPEDPRAVLLYTIRQMRALGQLRRPGESIGLTFAAWNAWRDGQKIQTLSTRDRKGKTLPMPVPL